MHKYILYFCLLITLNCYTKKVVTNGKKTDGFGAQFQQIIAASIYAELTQKDFFYSPFQEMEHNYDNIPDFISKKEKLINFIGNFKTIDEAIKNNYFIITDNYAFFFDAHVAACASSTTLKKIKEVFRANKNSSNYFNNNCLNIAIHIRRPNPHDSRTYGTDLPNDLYSKIIDKLRIVYSSRNLLFHIYSQGAIENFEDFKAEDIVLHLNETLEDTYTGMVLADVLVTGRSSLSYTAGYLSEGTVYYNSYPHAPLPHWISVDELLKQ